MYHPSYIKTQLYRKAQCLKYVRFVEECILG